jgi:geranylgeranyl reductase family protein
MFDCIIVGAGPAGATAAYHLAKKGHSVLVLEKSSLPRYKPCGGGVSPAIANWFDFDFAPVIKNTVSKVKYTWQLDDPMEVELQKVTPMWMVRRDEFDNFLMQKAIEQGVQLKDDTEVTGIQSQGDSWQVSTNHGVFEGAYLIAADGVNGPTARWLGFGEQQKVIAASLEVEAEVSERRQDLAYFDFGSLKNGFMWCFPKDNGYSFSGAYMRNNKGKPDELKKQLTNYASKFGLDLNNSKYTEYNLNVWQENQPLHTNRAVIAGEAAGIVDPLIGEGIRPAIFTGMKAAEAVANALSGSSDALGKYTETVNQEWGADLVLAQRLAGLFYQFPKIAYKVGVKRPSAAQLMGKILCGELRYSDVTEQATKKLKASFIPGFRG